MEKEGIEVGTSVVFSWEDCRWEGTSKKMVDVIFISWMKYDILMKGMAFSLM